MPEVLLRPWSRAEVGTELLSFGLLEVETVQREAQITGAEVLPVRMRSTSSTPLSFPVSPALRLDVDIDTMLRSFGWPASTEGTVLTRRERKAAASAAVTASIS